MTQVLLRLLKKDIHELERTAARLWEVEWKLEVGTFVFNLSTLLLPKIISIYSTFNKKI